MERAVTRLRPNNPTLAVGVFLVVAVVGLFQVKWSPYYHRALVAAVSHSIGPSILTGRAEHPPAASLGAAVGYGLAYGRAVWKAMLLGLLLGSAVQALLPMAWIARALGRTKFASVATGGMLAIPGMMCTCCAAPIVVGLRERRASPGSAIAFWLGNSILNPATLVFMGFVVGWNWAALRLALGLLMVFGLGYVVNRMAPPPDPREVAALPPVPPASGAFARWMTLFWRMAARLVPEYVVLVLLLGAARAWLFPHMGPEINGSLVWIAAFAAAGTMFVIPTAGEVPIVQAMLALGVGAGPVGALIMTLPPISAPSLAMVARSFPARSLALVVAAVIGFGMLGGTLALALGF